MDLRISDSFVDSLTRLTSDEQKSVKMTVFDMQIDSTSPGLSFHRLDKAKDRNFWSVRAGADIRIIVHRMTGSLLLCYVDHHDHAYEWAERRRLETHPKTGAAQLIELRETVQEIVVPMYVQADSCEPRKRCLFDGTPDDELLSYGVPAEWLDDVRRVDEDGLLQLADHLPGEAAEALLELATGGKPRIARPTEPDSDPFDHPDALRRFRIMTKTEELQRALEYPWEKWTIFLHPEQRQWVERDYGGPARVSGSAGTGKTIVALHRAVHLARTYEDCRVLLATFSESLAHALRAKLSRLIGNAPRLAERIDVCSVGALGLRLHKAHCGPANFASQDDLRELLRTSSDAVGGHRFSLPFLLSEWEHVVDAWQLENWEAYRDVARLGRKTRLPEPQRAALWRIFEMVRGSMVERGLTTESAMFTSLASSISGTKNPPYDFVVVDEAQDISVPQLRLFAAMAGSRPNALFFAGDLGQRIFQQPFSWKSLGVDVRGRSRTLRINYRTSHQIRRQADRLLGPEIADLDGNTEARSDTISVFNGPPPVVQVVTSANEEADYVCAWLRDRLSQGVLPHEIAVIVRAAAQLERAQRAVTAAGSAFRILDEHVETAHGLVAICTMHLAKGLEFRAVAVMACDDEVVPLQDRIETVVDYADLEEVYSTERHLLYVACTRARDYLLVTGVAPASEFLGDLTATVSG